MPRALCGVVGPHLLNSDPRLSPRLLKAGFLSSWAFKGSLGNLTQPLRNLGSTPQDNGWRGVIPFCPSPVTAWLCGPLCHPLFPGLQME